ncbi:MAG TPA: di-heme-cytochrome C peroxidase, partial [Blastocatellia bacterium]|nr:di-heme-cytochrome C peroxidase [Blastocatellia bacterium]
EVMPYDWVVALEQPNNQDPFVADDFMSSYRIIPDHDKVENPDELPIGFAKDDPDPITGIQNFGLTCATCHTALMTYKGTGIRIDGAPGLVEFDGFLGRVAAAVGATVADSSKFERFARKVLKDKYNAAAASALKKQVNDFMGVQGKGKIDLFINNLLGGEKNTRNGYGRIDALGSGGNRLYGVLDTKNLSALNAPVKAMPLWYSHEYNWVQTNGSIRQPMARNIIESLAVNASVTFGPGSSPKDWYVSSARLHNMYDLETYLARLKAPEWPEQIFGKIDQAAAQRGQPLYQQYCAGCHSLKMENKPEPGDDVAAKYNKTYWILRLFPADKIGTDPTDADNFADRTLDASSIKDQLPPPYNASPKNVPGAVVIGMVLGGIEQRTYADTNVPVEQQDLWNGYRANLLRACKSYPARPLAGIWACPPYLHNASVPSLYQLLLPAAERDKVFYTGSVEFDPVNVGYETTKIQGGFKYDTSRKGNSNAGHEYGVKLTKEQRMDLIEYLKTLKFPDANYQTADPQPECPK